MVDKDIVAYFDLFKTKVNFFTLCQSDLELIEQINFSQIRTPSLHILGSALICQDIENPNLFELPVNILQELIGIFTTLNPHLSERAISVKERILLHHNLTQQNSHTNKIMKI